MKSFPLNNLITVSRFSSDTMSQGDGVSERFHRNWKVYTAVLLIAVVSTAVFSYIYYSMSVASVTSISLDQIQAVRIFGSGNYPNRNATFIIEVQVWSKAQTLSVRLENPVVVADADTVPLGNQTLAGGTILPGAYLVYNLRFSVNESKAIGTIPYSAFGVTLRLTGVMHAGIYSRTVSLVHGSTWNWTTAKLILDGGCFNLTFDTPC